MKKNYKISFIAWVLSIVYLIFISIPVSITIFILVHLICYLLDINKFLKKTIKNAKAKSLSIFTKRVS